MSELTIKSMDIYREHDADFFIDRPAGSGDFDFIYFTTEIRLHSSLGERVEPPGTGIVYSPEHRQWYRGVSAGFNHHWFHAEGAKFAGLLIEYGISLDTPFRLRFDEFVPDILRQISMERQGKDDNWRRHVELLVEQLFLKVARNSHGPFENKTSRRKAELTESLRQIRIKVKDNYSENWTVKKMSELAFLSENRFAVLYSEFFGVSPMEDLIRTRLEEAKARLLNSDVAISAVAEECGFNSIFYFNRLFHRRVGCSPGKFYRKSVVLRKS